MNVFELRNQIINDYASFVGGFIKIRDKTIKALVDTELEDGLLWPDPLIQLSPCFEQSESVDTLVAQKILHEKCAAIFRYGKITDEGLITPGFPLQLHFHQAEAVRKARESRNYILTTGTGSGKSLAYIIPIVDHVLRTGSGKGVKAIVVYPMNALANSQKIELNKFLSKPNGERPDVTFERYTGQEDAAEKQRIIDNPPDILLTNFVMLELMLTRGGKESEIIKTASDLRFLVLDELHTYRGRQGADVAMLVRRTRDVTGAKSLLCVGTSATLASGGTQEEQKKIVADLGQRLFGDTVSASDIICERLRRVTKEIDFTNRSQAEVLKLDVQSVLDKEGPWSFAQLCQSSFASWMESTFGIRSEERTGVLLRQKPISVNDAAKKLYDNVGIAMQQGEEAIQKMLLLGHGCKNPSTNRPTFAFRLHQFISRGDTVYASLDLGDDRYFTFEKQMFVPTGKRDKRLYPLVFCRHCGHEFYSVTRRNIQASSKRTGSFEFVPRDLFERTIGAESEEVGFLYVSKDRPWPEELDETEIEKRVPDEWKDQDGNLIKSRKKELPEHVYLNPLGLPIIGALPGALGTPTTEEGIAIVFLKSPLRFCPCCGASYSFRHSNKKRGDFGKVSALGTEGRSSATTILTLSAVRHARQMTTNELPENARKILSFTDNRQDASLQAGHFNDFIKVSLLRGALYAAVKEAGTAGLRHSDLMAKVFDALKLDFNDYASNPLASKGNAKQETDIALWHVLGYRLYCDLERGWRITAPNLEQTGLLEFDYNGLADLAADEECWTQRLRKFWSNEKRDQSDIIAVHSALATATPQMRESILRDLLAWIRSELAIKVGYLDRREQDAILQRSFQRLVPPWGFDETDKLETLIYASVLYPRPKGRDDNSGATFLTAAGGFGDYLKRSGTFPLYGQKLTKKDAESIIFDLLSGLIRYGIMEKVETDDRRRRQSESEIPGFQLVAETMIWRAGTGEKAPRDSVRQPSGSSEGQMLNEFFRDYYRNIALATRKFNAHEHTAQVPYKLREEREEEFRRGTLPVLFCSPTMELGIDISELNLVNMRNVPPTPANYAQRSGRAGRSGQPALVLTYCSTGSQHDQYFFKRQQQMVAGVVTRPQIDLRNEELIRSHIHAIWLSESGESLGASLVDVLDMGGLTPEENTETGKRVRSIKLQERIDHALHDESIRGRVRRRVQAVLETIRTELQETTWYSEEWIDEILQQIPRQFEDATLRWRHTYLSALRQFDQQQSIMRDASRSAKDKDHAKNLHREAYDQMKLLMDKDNGTFTDFYSYRYFATEGFLPGYNFPRLPLTAYVPGERGRNEYLSRPRFLALSEFGPRAIVYHEGATYIINKVTLPLRQEGEDVITQSAKICQKCGYLHPPDSDGKHAHQNNCNRCNEALGIELTDLLRLQNVNAKRRMRINCDEEERLRYGYDIRTSIRFGQRGGQTLCQTADILVDGEKFGRLTYGDSAMIWRINFGYKRQKEEQRNGFVLDLERGYWGTNRDIAEADDDPDDPMSKRIRYVKPYVSDTKNCLLIEFANKIGEREMITLQAALRIGIRRVFELEESELAAEALPDSLDRKLLFFYESAEGGAGVLRKVLQQDLFSKIIRSTLEAAHYDPDTGVDLEDLGKKDRCDAGCYHCLLSYSNQFDHDKIDRKLLVGLLFPLRDVVMDISPSIWSRSEHLHKLKGLCESELERRWLDFMESGNWALPTEAQYVVETDEVATRCDFAYIDRHCKVLVYIDGPPHDYPERQRADRRQQNALIDAGWEVIRFHHQDNWHEIIKEYGHLFGK